MPGILHAKAPLHRRFQEIPGLRRDRKRDGEQKPGGHIAGLVRPTVSPPATTAAKSPRQCARPGLLWRDLWPELWSADRAPAEIGGDVGRPDDDQDIEDRRPAERLRLPQHDESGARHCDIGHAGQTSAGPRPKIPTDERQDRNGDQGGCPIGQRKRQREKPGDEAAQAQPGAAQRLARARRSTSIPRRRSPRPASPARRMGDPPTIPPQARPARGLRRRRSASEARFGRQTRPAQTPMTPP